MKKKIIKQILTFTLAVSMLCSDTSFSALAAELSANTDIPKNIYAKESDEIELDNTEYEIVSDDEIVSWDLTAYAAQNSYKLKLSKNGGVVYTAPKNGASAVQIENENIAKEALGTHKLNINDNYVLPGIPGDSKDKIVNENFLYRNGYLLTGWNTKKTIGKGKHFDLHEELVNSGKLLGVTKKKSEITLYAEWTPIDYQITYVLNDDNDKSTKNDNPSTYNAASSVKLKNPKRDGYKFDGWYLTEDFTGKKQTSISKKTCEDVTLYAKWKEITYTVAFKLNGGTAVDKSETENRIFSYFDTEFGYLPDKDSVVNGYITFKGWRTKANGKGHGYAPGTPIAEVFEKEGFKNLTLYADWGSASDQAIYNSMIKLKKKYPEGMRWTNDNFYQWKGGIYYGGYGCAGFAFLLSDAAFGDAPSRIIYNTKEMRVGDILRVNNNTHSVIILEVNDDSITVAEGNYNSSIHWGRVITKSELKQTFTYLMTRYPQ